MLFMMLFHFTSISRAANQRVEVIQEGQKELTYPYNTTFPNRMLQYNGKLVYNINSLNEKISQIEIEKIQEYSNSEISNIILAGYPYKTPEELNCQNEFEAYIATQEAIYYILEPRDIGKYKITKESGNRILEATMKIAQEARKVSSIHDIQLTQKTEEFIEDSLDSNYFMKEYEIQTNGRIRTGSIQLIAGEGVQITDLNNQPKNNFQEKDCFKILIPKANTMQNMSIKLEADFIKVKMLLGDNTDRSHNYGVVVLEEEIEKISRHIDIKNAELSTIQITNLAKDTQKPIVGATFTLYNQNYETLQENLTTDEKGEILLNNVEPGIYHIKQTKTQEGYSLMNYYIKLEVIAENRITKVKIINDKTKEQVIENKEKEINVQEENYVIKETNNKDIANIYNNNTIKEVTENINENNYYNNRDFINNIRIKNIKNEQNNDIYKNLLYRTYTNKSYNENLEDNNQQEKQNWINYIELKTSGTTLLKLPKAGI